MTATYLNLIYLSLVHQEFVAEFILHVTLDQYQAMAQGLIKIRWLWSVHHILNCLCSGLVLFSVELELSEIDQSLLCFIQRNVHLSRAAHLIQKCFENTILRTENVGKQDNVIWNLHFKGKLYIQSPTTCFSSNS